MMNGFIKLHRQLTEWEWYEDVNARLTFIHCLIVANFKPKKWKGHDIKRGQFISSLGKLSTAIGISKQQLRTVLEKFEKTGEMTSEGQGNNTLFTVCNYNDYQDIEKENENAVTRFQHTSNTPVTRFQYASNTQVTTTKEGKKEKNEEELKTTLGESNLSENSIDPLDAILNEDFSEDSLLLQPNPTDPKNPHAFQYPMSTARTALQTFYSWDGKREELNQRTGYPIEDKLFKSQLQSFIEKMNAYWKPINAPRNFSDLNGIFVTWVKNGYEKERRAILSIERNENAFILDLNRLHGDFVTKVEKMPKKPLKKLQIFKKKDGKQIYENMKPFLDEVNRQKSALPSYPNPLAAKHLISLEFQFPSKKDKEQLMKHLGTIIKYRKKGDSLYHALKNEIEYEKI